MATIEENKTTWDGNYNWENRGDEWSKAWGGPFMQWYGTIFPRIKAHVPTSTILEIACGYGRWTNYLKDLCNHLTVIDLSEECITACKQRFSSFSHLEYHVNDGKSLQMIPDGSIDFVFSFDSLVHADISIIEAYFSQFPRILSSNGVCFIHHSNLGAYYTKYAIISKIPKLEGLLKAIGLLDHDLGWRDFTVDAQKLEALAKKHGLVCVSQEIIHWGTKKTLTDCISTITKCNSTVATHNKIFKNPDFMTEAKIVSQLSRLYSPEIKMTFNQISEPLD
jgi:SAM-dependent methyltransferase